MDVTPLNAGPAVTLTPPSGAALTLNATSPAGGQYKSGRSGLTLPSGTWAFSDGAGGPDVGPLSFNFPVPPPVSWTNQSAISGSAIDRTQPLTVTWSGGDPNGYVDIQGFSQVFSVLSGQYIVGFQCSAPESAGQFTIPPSILLGMPGGNVFGNIQVSTVALPNIVGNVPGFTASVTGSQFQTQVPVVFK